MSAKIILGTPIVLGVDVYDRKRTGMRKFTGMPDGVIKWRIRCRGPIGRNPAKLYLHFQDGRTEEWIMKACGTHRMQPIICQGININGNINATKRHL